jgi:hypothetical protein
MVCIPRLTMLGQWKQERYDGRGNKTGKARSVRNVMSRDNSLSVSIVTRLLSLGPTQHPVEWVPGALSPGVKLPRHETHHLHRFDIEFTNAWSCISALLQAIISWRLIRHRDSFLLLTFTSLNYIL